MVYWQTSPIIRIYEYKNTNKRSRRPASFVLFPLSIIRYLIRYNSDSRAKSFYNVTMCWVQQTYLQYSRVIHKHSL